MRLWFMVGISLSGSPHVVVWPVASPAHRRGFALGGSSYTGVLEFFSHSGFAVNQAEARVESARAADRVSRVLRVMDRFPLELARSCGGLVVRLAQVMRRNPRETVTNRQECRKKFRQS